MAEVTSLLLAFSRIWASRASLCWIFFSSFSFLFFSFSVSKASVSFLNCSICLLSISASFSLALFFSLICCSSTFFTSKFILIRLSSFSASFLASATSFLRKFSSMILGSTHLLYSPISLPIASCLSCFAFRSSKACALFFSCSSSSLM